MCLIYFANVHDAASCDDGVLIPPARGGRADAARFASGRLALANVRTSLDGLRDHNEARAAFAACQWIIDGVMARVPIWKHERYADGDAGWLHPGA